MKAYRFEAVVEGNALPLVCALAINRSAVSLPTASYLGKLIVWKALPDPFIEIESDSPGIVGAPIQDVRRALSTVGYYIIEANVTITVLPTVL